MQPYRTTATVGTDGTVTVTGLPFRAGDRVEVVVVPDPQADLRRTPHPLRDATRREDAPGSEPPTVITDPGGAANRAGG